MAEGTQPQQPVGKDRGKTAFRTSIAALLISLVVLSFSLPSIIERFKGTKAKLVGCWGYASSHSKVGKLELFENGDFYLETREPNIPTRDRDPDRVRGEWSLEHGTLFLKEEETDKEQRSYTWDVVRVSGDVLVLTDSYRKKGDPPASSHKMGDPTQKLSPYRNNSPYNPVVFLRTTHPERDMSGKEEREQKMNWKRMRDLREIRPSGR